MYEDLRKAMVEAIVAAEERKDAAGQTALRMALSEFLRHHPDEFYVWNEMLLPKGDN